LAQVSVDWRQKERGNRLSTPCTAVRPATTIFQESIMKPANLYQDIPDFLPGEQFSELARGRSFHLERIVSRGHSTADGEWYDQSDDEWVVLLQGRARLRFQGDDTIRNLNPGDHLLIPAHMKHRVEWTEPGGPTVWLALHFRPGPDDEENPPARD